jgi:hypothetical protein
VRARKKAIEHGVSILERKGHRGPITEQQARLAVELAEKARPLAKPTSPPKHVGPGRGKKKVNAVGAAKSVSSASSANGTNNEYLTARIARDRPDILERMKAGENANKVVALATVAPAQSPEPPPPGPGRGYKKANPQNEGQLFRNRNTTHAEAERLRAINRAPEPAKDLYDPLAVALSAMHELARGAPQPFRDRALEIVWYALAALRARDDWATTVVDRMHRGLKRIGSNGNVFEILEAHTLVVGAALLYAKRDAWSRAEAGAIAALRSGIDARWPEKSKRVDDDDLLEILRSAERALRKCDAREDGNRAPGATVLLLSKLRGILSGGRDRDIKTVSQALGVRRAKK